MTHEHNENCNHDPIANIQEESKEALQFAETIEVPERLEAQILTMLRLQDKMNSKVNPEWRTAKNNWLRAIWVECAELMDWTDWKWWKKNENQLNQIQIEVVDIWHFGMSLILEGYLSNPNNTIEDLAKLLANNVRDIYKMQIPIASLDIKVITEAIVHSALNPPSEHNPVGPSFQLGAFMWLLRVVDMSTDDLYRKYVDKNVLNIFRQDNGYKEGTYIKEWQGREDNDHLMELTENLDPTSINYYDEIYALLDARYQDIKAAA